MARGRFIRRAALALLVLGLVPGTFLRTAFDPANAAIALAPLPHGAVKAGPFVLEGLWQIEGRGERFGGYSAILLPDAATIRLFSDRGQVLTMARPGSGTRAPMVSELEPVGFPAGTLFDIESATSDGQRLWIGYESRHTIYRFGPGDAPQGFVEPPYARSWSVNGGIEAIVRTRMGWFMVFREEGGDLYLYPGDPVDGAEPARFAVDWPEGYSPTDAAELPDGRVLVLLRRLAWHMPVFESRLALIDPARLDPDSPLAVTTLLQAEALLPRDNWEALAVESGASPDVLTLWLASDDNRSSFQRSLLAKVQLTLPPEPPRAP